MKKLISLASVVLSVLMAVTMVMAAETSPVAKIGETNYTTLQAAIDAATNGNTVVLLDNVTENVTVTGEIILDLNGKNITSSTDPITVEGGNLTVIGTGGGKIITTDASDGEGIIVKQSGKVTINSGTIESACYGIYVYTSGGTVNMNGGAITLTGENKDGMAIAVGSAAGSATITNGDVISNGVHWPVYTWGGTISITGGTFDFVPSADYIAANHTKVNNGNGTYSVIEKFPDAIVIGTEKFDTLADAFAAATENDVITITKPGTYTWASAAIPSGLIIEATVDGVAIEAAKSLGTQVISNLSNANGVTFKNIDFTASLNNGKAAYVSSSSVQTMTFEGCSFTGLYAFHVDSAAAGAKFTFKDCVFNGFTTFGSSVADINISGGELNGTLVLRQETTMEDVKISEDAVISINDEEAAAETSITMNDCSVIDSEGNESTAKTLTDIVAETEKSVIVDNVMINAVAEVDNVPYTTLTDAIAAAQDGDTITLLADVTADTTVTINNSIILDGDSHTISGSASPLLKLNSTKNITVQNVTLTATNNVVRWGYVNEGYTHTYLNCQISGGVYGIHYDGRGGEVVIEGCTIDGFNAFAGSLEEVTIKDTTFEAKNSGYAGANLWGHAVVENVTLVDDGKTTWLDVKTTAEVTGGKVVKGDTEIPLESYLDAAAKIGTTYYTTLTDAIAAAQDGDTISLVADIVVEDTSFVVKKKLTIDLNGHNISGTSNASKNFQLIDVIGGTLTLQGNGTISLTHTGANLGWNALSAVAAVSNNNSTAVRGSLTVEDGVTLEHKGGTDMAYGIDLIAYDGGSVTVNGGNIVSTYRAIRVFGNNGVKTLTVNGGSVYGENAGIFLQHLATGKTGCQATVDINGGTISANSETGRGIYLYTVANNTGSINVTLDDCTVSGATPLSMGITTGTTTAPQVTKGESVEVAEPSGYAWIENVLKKVFTVSFETYDGSPVADQIVVLGETPVKPNAPTLENHSFLNWYVGENDSQVFDFTAPVTQDVTAYARWTYNAPSVPVTPPVEDDCTGGENCPCNSYGDVDCTLWYHDALDYVVDNGIMIGVAEDSFNPNGKVTRAMMWTILARINGVEVNSTGENWYAEARTWAMNAGITDGTNPMQAITREQMVTMLWRSMGSPASQQSLAAYTDAAQISSWAQTAVAWAVQEGILQGRGNGGLDPAGTATRAEVATILYNISK